MAPLKCYYSLKSKQNYYTIFSDVKAIKSLRLLKIFDTTTSFVIYHLINFGLVGQKVKLEKMLRQFKKHRSTI